MRFEAPTMEEFMDVSNSGRCRYKRITKMIEEFWNSDQQIVKVEFTEKEYKSVKSASSSFIKAVKKMKVGVVVITRKGKLYLIKENEV